MSHTSPKLTKVQHNSTRSRPLDIRDCLRFGDLELPLGGLGWCCEGNTLDSVSHGLGESGTYRRTWLCLLEGWKGGGYRVWVWMWDVEDDVGWWMGWRNVLRCRRLGGFGADGEVTRAG
jgi:hypothetical protein